MAASPRSWQQPAPASRSPAPGESRVTILPRRGRRLRLRWTIPIQAGRANETDRLERRGRLDVEANTVPILDRPHSVLAPAPEQGDEQRVAGSDRRDLREQDPGHPADDREGRDRPEPDEGDPRVALGGQARRGPRRAQRGADRLGGPGRSAQDEPDHRRDQPPGPAEDRCERRVLVLRSPGPRGPPAPSPPRDKEHRDPQELGEEHQPASARRTSRTPSVPSTTTSASAAISGGLSSDATPTRTAVPSREPSGQGAERAERVEVRAIVAREERRVERRVLDQQPVGPRTLVDARHRAQLQHLAPQSGSASRPRAAAATSRATAWAAGSSGAPRQWTTWIGPLSSRRKPSPERASQSSPAMKSAVAAAPAARPRHPGRLVLPGTSSSNPWLPT